MFRALVIENDENDGHTCQLADCHEAQLPAGEVTVAVRYSTLNYKDALAITGRGKVVRHYPMVPGIDLVGEVIDSTHDDYQAGDDVLLNGWGVGEKHWGGLSQKARLNGDWLIPRPEAFSSWQTMALGTAGYTAMLSVMRLEQLGVTPQDGEILVTGASGGVGSVAIALLAALGYSVVAATGRPDQAEYLKTLGAGEIIDRQCLSTTGPPLSRARWAGAVDCVGSHTLANVCASMRYGGVVTACGLAQGMALPASVAPFILRGITLAGIDSVMRSRQERLMAWQRLGALFDPALLDTIVSHDIGLGQCIETARALIEGQVRGRVVVDVRDS